MKVDFVEPFVRGACSVLERILGSPTALGQLSLLGMTYSVGNVNVAARVSGSLRGEVVYSMSSLTAQKFADLTVGGGARGFGPLTGSALARLGDMIGQETERLLSEMGQPCDVGSPIVLQGINVEFSAVTPALAVPIETDAGQVKVSVAVRDGGQA